MSKRYGLLCDGERSPREWQPAVREGSIGPSQCVIPSSRYSVDADFACSWDRAALAVRR